MANKQLNYTAEEINNILDKANTMEIPNVPTKVSDLENDSNYATETYVKNEIANAQLGGDDKGVDLSGYATKDELPTKTSQLTNDSGYITEIPSEYITETELNAKGYLTEHQDLSDYALKSEIPTDYLTSIPSEYITETELNAKGYLTEHQSLEGYAKTSDLHNHDNKSVLDNITSTKISEWNNKSTFSGNYNDLTNKPTIPTVPTNISSFTNDSGYITSIPSEYITEIELNNKGYATESYVTTAIDNAQLSGSGETVDMTKYALKTDIPTATSQLTNDSNFITSIPSEYVTETELTAKGYLTEHQDISGKADKTELHNHTNKTILDGITSDKITSWDNKSNFDGNYNSLTNKPSIPSIDGLATEDYVNQEINKINVTDQLTDYAKKSELPTKTSELTNDSNFLTSIPSEYITETELTSKDYATKDYVTEIVDNASMSGGYTHPETHPATMITGLSTVATSGSYNDLSNKPTIPTVTNDLTNTLKSNYDTAYTHSQSAHAPSNAQKNSDITKTEIEAKLTGDITSHTHSQYLTEHQDLSNYALKSEIPTDYLTSIPSEYITETELNAKGYATTSQIPTSLPANGGNADTVDGFNIWSGTQAQYDAIETKSDTTIYLIKEE